MILSPCVYAFKHTTFHADDFAGLNICKSTLCRIRFRSTVEGDSLRENKVTVCLKRIKPTTLSSEKK